MRSFCEMYAATAASCPLVPGMAIRSMTIWKARLGSSSTMRMLAALEPAKFRRLCWGHGLTGPDARIFLSPYV